MRLKANIVVLFCSFLPQVNTENLSSAAVALVCILECRLLGVQILQAVFLILFYFLPLQENQENSCRGIVEVIELALFQQLLSFSK